MDLWSISMIVTAAVTQASKSINNYVSLWNTNDILANYTGSGKNGDTNVLEELLTEYQEGMNFRIGQEQEKTDFANAILNRNIGWTREDQSRSANLASNLNTSNQALMYAQLSELLAQGEQAEGQAIQTVATSGFRNTGSARNIVTETRRQASYQEDVSRRQIQLNAAQSYAQAGEAYLSADRKVADYQANIDQNLLTLELFMEDEERNWGIFQEDVADLQAEFNALQTQVDKEKWLSPLLSVFTGGIYTGRDFASELNQLQKEYERLEELVR